MIHVGDLRTVLPTLDAQSVQCVVTQPGLRDSGVTGNTKSSHFLPSVKQVSYLTNYMHELELPRPMRTAEQK